jgi:single-strand DNA-binding protein
MDTFLTIQGNLVADPTQRSTASGATVVGFRVASSSRRFDKQAGEYRDGEPMFIAVSCWRGLGGNVFATLRKGDSVVVFGRLLHRTYDDKSGSRRNVHEIDAIAVGPDLGRCAADLRRPVRTADVTPTASDATAGLGDADSGQETPTADVGSVAA